MKKKVISAILCAAMVSTMAVGCSSSDSKKDSKSDKKDGYKVAYIARAQEDSFAAWLADEMRAAFKKTTRKRTLSLRTVSQTDMTELLFRLTTEKLSSHTFSRS